MKVGRKPVGRMSAEAWAAHYGVGKKTIYYFGLSRFEAMTEDARLVMVGMAKRTAQRRRKAA